MKHGHYFKDVSKLQTIDVYRVIGLYGVTDACLQHALKKVLCAGTRGAKDQARDVQEAIDTLTRWQEMRAEDGDRMPRLHGHTELELFFDESRADAIGQNGNGGEHYGLSITDAIRLHGLGSEQVAAAVSAHNAAYD